MDRASGRGFLLKKDLPDLEKVRTDQGIVRLLPSFDPFMLGHRERGHLLDRAHYKQVYKEAGWLARVVLVDGRVAGTWSYRRKARKLDVAVKMFRTFNKETRTEVQQEARDLSRFLELPDMAVRFTK